LTVIYKCDIYTIISGTITYTIGSGGSLQTGALTSSREPVWKELERIDLLADNPKNTFCSKTKT
jgi:hypothetical protein